MQFRMLKAKSYDSLVKSINEYVNRGWYKTAYYDCLVENGERYFYKLMMREGEQGRWYTPEEIADARKWLTVVCESQNFYDPCTHCPLEHSCDFTTAEGLENVMRVYRENRQNV